MLQVQLEIGADPSEVARARRWARARLWGAGVGVDEPLAETLVLLVSELVTNAVVHTGRPAVLRLRLPGAQQSGGAVRVEVADASAAPPRQRHADADDAHGRGLELVAGLADRWGWQPYGGGKRIWCELDRAASPVAVPAEGDCPVCFGHPSRAGHTAEAEAAEGIGRPGRARAVPSAEREPQRAVWAERSG